MEQCKGKAIVKKIAIGKVLYYERAAAVINQEYVGDTAAELYRYKCAVTQAAEQLDVLYRKALQEVGETEADILMAQQQLLQDPILEQEVRARIENQHMDATAAVAMAGRCLAEHFAHMEDENIRERAADILDVAERLVNVLQGTVRKGITIDEPVIVVADSLSPSETIQMDKSKLLGLVIRHGSAQSHTAILARTMNIPALRGVELQPSWNGHMAILDGEAGMICIDPDEEMLEGARRRQEDERSRARQLEMLRGMDTVTREGKRIRLYANISSVEDAETALQNDAEGIGLFRSEFLYLESADYPTEQQQYLAYKAVAEKMAGKKVIIRTLDIGGDKQAGYFKLEKEDNPAMGYRAIRICLTRQDIFKTQLRAILRASVHGNVAIMFPMIISLQELKEAKAIMQQAREELMSQGIACREVEIGIMIETPAAVMISEELAQEVDFFSIGTNDLTQYTLAIDRQNSRLDAFYDAHHPAVLRMIRMTVENGHKGGAWVGICGELAEDPELTETFIRMGVDELSVSPAMVLQVRERVRSI